MTTGTPLDIVLETLADTQMVLVWLLVGALRDTTNEVIAGILSLLQLINVVWRDITFEAPTPVMTNANTFISLTLALVVHNITHGLSLCSLLNTHWVGDDFHQPKGICPVSRIVGDILIRSACNGWAQRIRCGKGTNTNIKISDPVLKETRLGIPFPPRKGIRTEGGCRCLVHQAAEAVVDIGLRYGQSGIGQMLD